MKDPDRGLLKRDRLSLGSRWPAAVMGLGLLLVVTLAVEGFLLLTADPTPPDGYLAGVVTSLPFIGFLIYGGHWLDRSDISPARYDRIARWCLAGIVLFSAFILWITLNTGYTSAFSILGVIRWTTAVGGGIGVVIGIANAREVDHAIEAERARNRQRKLQRERDRLDEFADIVSHDLRNPLTVAEGRLALAREESDSEHLEAVETALGRMDSIIQDTLTLARQGQSVGDTEPVELQAVVEDCWSGVPTDSASVSVEASGRVLADRQRLSHVFENLFRNAVEHGGDSVTVRVGSLETESGFYVADDGPGIPPDRRETVFDIGSSDTEDGSGFGLAIVKRIVEAHGWSIRVTEGSSGGARFEITGVTWAGS